MTVKEKLNLTIEKELKARANSLAEITRLSVSEIFELLIKGTSENEIIKMYNKKLKEEK